MEANEEFKDGAWHHGVSVSEAIILNLDTCELIKFICEWTEIFCLCLCLEEKTRIGILVYETVSITAGTA